MYNKKGKINKPVGHTSWRNKGFYFEDYEPPSYENKDELECSVVKLYLNRVSLILFRFLVVALRFGSEMIYLASIKKENHCTNEALAAVVVKRQDFLGGNRYLRARDGKVD